ncbi:MAG: hypothetical protein B7Y39_06245 [Bdellovibrio sp. 28-41-41]|nr:MAG: hypothetical protein B7Y39_06245 [Bdellovibrio sp. 28-41-41]
MKSGFKLLILSISCLTLASGCTKKNTNKNDKTEKVEAEDTKKDGAPATGPIKEDPKPSTSTSGDTSGAAPVSTPTAADEAAAKAAGATQTPAADTSSSSGAGSTVTQPGATATPIADTKTSNKTELELFDECITPKIASAISKEREKDNKTIVAKKLFETKIAILKDCPKPAAKSDEAEAMINKKIAEYTVSKFSDIDDSIDTFMGVENEKVSESERAKIYDNIIAEAAAAKLTASTTTVVPTVPAAQVQPVATPQLTPTPTAPVPPTSTAAPKATTPVRADAAKTQASAPEVAKKDSELVTNFKGCYSELINKSISGMKNAKTKAITPKELIEAKVAASALCSRSTIKDSQLDAFTTQVVVDLATKNFPESAAGIKFFAETEAKNGDLKSRRQAYSAYGKPKDVANDTAKTAAKPAVQADSAPPIAKDKTASAAVVQNTAPVELKDLPSFEKCINETSDTLIKISKEKTAEINSPYQLALLRNILLTQCKMIQTAESKAALHKIINGKVKANYPKSGVVLEFYNTVMASSYQDELKEILVRYYGLASEFKFLNTTLAGALLETQTAGNVVTYSLKQIAGEIQSTVGEEGKEPYTSRMPLSEEPIENVNFAFDLNPKENNVGTLTIIEGKESFQLEFTFVKGDAAQLKAKQPVTIAFSNESWSRVLESKLRHTVGIPKHLVPKFPFKYSIENQNGQNSRLCELTATDMKCTDPNSVIKFKLNKNSLVLPM